MAEITLANGIYRTGRLTPKQQLHLARRIAPLATTFSGDAAQATAAFTGYVAKMSDADVDAIVDPCLMVCQRKIADGAWAPITAAGSATLMYQDIGVQEIFELTIAVLRDNLGNFFPGQAAPGSSATLKA